MINFYKFYNKNGLDNDHYNPLINQFLFSPLSPADQLDTLVSELKQIEHIIKKSPQYAYYYACHIIKRRFIVAEQYIKKNDYWWKAYGEQFYD